MNKLDFTRVTLCCAPLGPEAPMPDLKGISNIQNQTRFDLGEEDELYQGYGQRPNGYPYRIYSEYSRALEEKQVDAAILENDLMRAVFLPGFGGRLWQLTDKVSGREVVYVNDVLRPSNLAVRGAWFSGGVEWNMGVIGHTPLTMDRIFAARLDSSAGPVLRMYGYERSSGAVYQMDFWLDDETPALNCHMSVTNPTDQVLPMYWWSNIATPLYPGGRVFVPAHAAYTQAGGAVHRVSIPLDGDADVSRYDSIPTQRDYFFDLDQGAPRWLAHLDKNGWGLLHTSTQRLQSRKLFVWGKTLGGEHWQQFLTDQAGPYLEVQAGLAKTQYGCIPMSPQTTWQWTERYQPLDLAQPVEPLDFDETSAAISAQVDASPALERADALGRSIRRQTADVLFTGSGDAALEDLLRAHSGQKPLSAHLDFSSSDPRQGIWAEYLQTGIVPDPAPETAPDYDLTGRLWLERLTAEVEQGRPNWFIYYMLALLEAEAGRPDLAVLHLDLSLSEQPTAWAWYAQAVLDQKAGEQEDCVTAVREALELYRKDAAFTKACLLLLANAGAWSEMLEQIGRLDAQQAANGRIRFFEAQALCHLGEARKALDILEENGGMELADQRECEVAAGQLWQKCMLALTGQVHPVPEHMQFDSGALPAELWDEV